MHKADKLLRLMLLLPVPATNHNLQVQLLARGMQICASALCRAIVLRNSNDYIYFE